MVGLNQKVKPDPDVIIAELEDNEAVLLHLGTKMYFTLNKTALRIWQMLGDGLANGEITEKIQEEFDVTPEKARESVINLVDELITEKLARVVDE